jgi:hypothetical protein
MARVHYVVVWKLHGANKLVADKSPFDLIRLDNPALIATVTDDPKPYFQHIDRATAIGAAIFKVFSASDKGRTFAERLADDLETVRSRRAKQTEKGVFLVLECETEIQQPDFKNRRETEEFVFCLDAIEKPKIREIFHPQIQAILTAISLSLPVNADRQIERIGEAIYLVDTESHKPIYSFSLTAGSLRVSLASPLPEGMVAAARKRVSRIIGDKTLVRPADLFITSINQATDALQAFIAAWSGLEIFVNANFKATYESEWFSTIKHGAPVAAAPVFERFRGVMRDKYRLADKFLIIASVLDADAAASDAEEFARLKKIRDDLLHALETPEHLPTEAAQKLLLKYLSLHLDRTA